MGSLKSTKGTVTIEATLVFPIILLTTLGLIFGSLYVYQKCIVYLVANELAEHAAYTWDNSEKDFITGAYDLNQHDGLYWRSFNDSVSDLFQFLVSNSPSQVSLETNSSQSQDTITNLPVKKLLRAKDYLPVGLSGTLSYTNHGFERMISVHLESKLQLPAVLTPLLGDGLYTAEAASAVNEPVEFIRSIELVRYYLPYLTHYVNRKQLNQIMDRFRDKSGNVEAPVTMAFRSHADAKTYLQNAVNGHGTTVTTTGTGKWRMIDALTAEGVAHQAYIGYQSQDKDLIEQMDKDVELLQKGKLKGAVWHFFKKDGNEQWGPSKALRQKLEQHGIIVVIHS